MISDALEMGRVEEVIVQGAFFITDPVEVAITSCLAVILYTVCLSVDRASNGGYTVRDPSCHIETVTDVTALVSDDHLNVLGSYKG